MNEKISVCIPVYNGSETILQTIQSVLTQTLKDFELIIIDNASSDNTVKLIESLKDDRLRLYKNLSNLGCGGNLNECIKKATGDFIFFVCADDLVDKNGLQKVYDAFRESEDIGVVMRPYYWFDEDYLKPVRMTKQFERNEIVSLNSSHELIKDVLDLSGQLSGIGFRKKYMNYFFSNEPFIETASMVIEILKSKNIIILKDNIVAVRIGHSNANSYSVYSKSPMLAWYNLTTRALAKEEFKPLRKYLIKNFIANNYIGLIQIKNFGSYQFLFREIWYLLKFRWYNIFNFSFWFFVVGTIIIPRFILKKIVVLYKNKINSQLLKNLSIKLNN